MKCELIADARASDKVPLSGKTYGIDTVCHGVWPILEDRHAVILRASPPTNSASMWCNRCQQDVPATAQNDAGGLSCACCGNTLSRTMAAAAKLEHTAKPAPIVSEPLGQPVNAEKSVPEGPAKIFSDWRLEDDLREARRLVRMAQMQMDDSPAAAGEDETASPTPASSPAPPAPAMQPRALHRGGSNFGWMIAGLGFSGLVCGCALLVWSQVAARAELWNVGLPIALVSQAILVVGVLLLLDFGSIAAAPVAPAIPTTAPNTSHLHVHSGGLHASGISVHFSNALQQTQGDGSQLTRQIEAAMRRAA